MNTRRQNIGFRFQHIAKAAALLLTTFWLLTSMIPFARAAVCGDEVPKDQDSLKTYISDCNSKLGQLSGQKQTLASAIDFLNTQIKLTQAKIYSTTQQLDKLNIEIADLSGTINSLDLSLDDLTKIFVSRVRETYIRKTSYHTDLVAQSLGVSDILKGIEYNKKIRDRDQNVMLALEKSRLDASVQKESKESKLKEIALLKAKLDSDKAALSNQIASKNELLAITKNDEKKYSQLLSEAQAELMAIQGIIAGLGVETASGRVGEGQRVASLIIGRSPCSSNTHLHYEVAKDGARRNPFELLKNTSLSWDNADSPQNGSGSWNWPIADPIRITQGYGHTSYSSIYANSTHTGIDMVNTANNTVNAVKPGDLFQGGMKCGSGTLKYVRVKQDDGFDSYYLHVNY